MTTTPTSTRPRRDALRRSVLPLAMAFGLIAAGCGSDASDGASRAGDDPTTTPADGVGESTADGVLDCGIEVPINDGPKKVFAVYQPAIELAHALDLGDQLVGTAYIDNVILPEYADAQAETEYFADIPSKEELLDLGADFVISGFPGVYTAEGYGSRGDLRKLGVETWLISTVCPSEDGLDQDELAETSVTMETVYENVLGLGEVFGKTEEAEAVVADMKAEIAEVEELVDGAEKPSVAMLSYSKEGFGVYGTDDPADEIIKLAGGTNVFDDLRGHYNPKVGVEELIERNPDVILVEACCDTDLLSSGAEADVQAILDDPALANVSAVKEGRVYSIGFADVSGGVRNAHSVTMVAGWLHPDLVG